MPSLGLSVAANGEYSAVVKVWLLVHFFYLLMDATVPRDPSRAQDHVPESGVKPGELPKWNHHKAATTASGLHA